MEPRHRDPLKIFVGLGIPQLAMAFIAGHRDHDAPNKARDIINWFVRTVRNLSLQDVVRDTIATNIFSRRFWEIDSAKARHTYNHGIMA